MRRWFVILMLTLLPLQFSWAAVAAYCGHDSSHQAQHLGHHEHQHADQAIAKDNSSPADQNATAALDFDCGHCHGTCASMPAALGSTAAITLASHLAAPVEGHLRSIAQTPPERPQWLPLA